MASEGKITFELKAYKHVNGKPDIRRFVLDPTSESLHDELMSKLTRAYKEDAAQLHLYWKDSENEFVSLETDDDLQVAFSFANGSLLKVFVVKAGEKHVAEEFGEAAPSVTSSSEQKSAEFEVRGGVHHPHVVCDGCNSAIYGRRFKCVECADFDLCERCELVNNRHPEHNMILIRRPSSRGCPYMFNGRNRAFCGPSSYPGCPMGRGPHCGRFSHAQTKQAEAPSAEQSNAEQELRMRFADMLRSAQNGEFPAVLAAVNEVLRPLGADLSVQVDAPVQRSDSATATEKGSNDNADSSEQAGTPLGNGAEQASQTQPQSSSTASVETSTVHVETTDKPTCTESQHTVNVSTSTGFSTGNELYADTIKQLLDMGFDNSNGWLERLVHAKKGNFVEILDLLVSK